MYQYYEDVVLLVLIYTIISSAINIYYPGSTAILRLSSRHGFSEQQRKT